MNLRLFHIIGVVLILFVTVECATVTKSADNSTIVNYKDTKSCENIITQEKCLQSSCIWCETECIKYGNLNVLQGKLNNCIASEAINDYEELQQLKYGGAFFWIIGGVILGFCCCGCFCCGCFLG